MKGYAIDEWANKTFGKAPCVGCEDRFVGCHSSKCPHGYIEWAEKRKRFIDQAREKVDAEYEAEDFRQDAIEKVLRRNGKKMKERR